MSRDDVRESHGERVLAELDFLMQTLDELLLIRDRGKDALVEDVLLQRAVEGCVNRIGDTVRNKIPLKLQDEFRGQDYWSGWVDWRVKLAHHYHTLDVNILWQDLERDVPDFRQLIADEILS